MIAVGFGSFFGPIGIIVAGFVPVAVGISSSQSNRDADSTSMKTNCPSCGARNERDADVCHHCGTVVSED